MAETSVFLAGNLTNDPELHHTTSGKPTDLDARELRLKDYAART
jgi:hypothetical protein